jgi:CRISPR-associated protein Csm4
MTPLKVTIRPRTAFGSVLHGDTLFGQVCWTIVHRLGSAALDTLLSNYAQGNPFAVIGDAFPAGHIPRPLLPASYQNKLDNADERKVAKSKIWLSLADIEDDVTPINQIANNYASSNKDIDYIQESSQQARNSINRLTGTTGEAGFAPYQSEQIWFSNNTQLDLYCLIDEKRLSLADFEQLITDIGLTGYGRDASIGLGKFSLESITAARLPHHQNPTHYLTLGNIAPQGLGFDAKTSYYKPFTRFGRHGSLAVASGKPFKAPILLTQAGSVFATTHANAHFIGQGLGGCNKPVSNYDPRTVHQGYAPVLRVRIEKQ